MMLANFLALSIMSLQLLDELPELFNFEYKIQATLYLKRTKKIQKENPEIQMSKSPFMESGLSNG